MCVCVCVIQEERERGRGAWGLLYNTAEPVFADLGRSHCDISGLTDVLIGGGKKSLFKFSKSGIL